MFIVLWHGIIDDLSNVQEEDAQENEQKIESERTNVKEAQDELKKHETVLMNINQKYADVKNKMEQLSDETDQLKVSERAGRSVYNEMLSLNILHLRIYIYINTLPGKSFWTVRFLMCFKELSFAHQPCIYLIQTTDSKSSNIVKYFYYL